MKPLSPYGTIPFRLLALPMAMGAVWLGGGFAPLEAQSNYATPFVVTTVAGTPGVPGSGSGQFSNPAGITLGPVDGNLYVGDSNNECVRIVTTAGAISTFAGAIGFVGSSDGTGAAAQFRAPEGIAADASGNLYVADSLNNTIRKITPAGVVTTLAGQAGQTGSTNATGAAARFHAPNGIVVGSDGNIYVCDVDNSTIRKITPGGVVTTLAGSAGVTGSSNGTGNAAQFNFPNGIASGSDGNLYVADTFNHTIRKVTLAGVVTTLVGQPGTPGSSDGTGSAANFNTPYGIAADSSGNLYVADTSNNAIRLVTLAGVATTLAGQPGTNGSADGTGSAAQFNSPYAIAVNPAGQLYITDLGNDTIRKASSPVQSTPTTTWVNGAGDSFWSDSSNWSAGIPAVGSNVAIGTQPSGNIIESDTGLPTTITGLTFNNSLSAGVSVVASGVESLQVNGNITNSSASPAAFAIPVIAGTSGAYAGGSAGLNFNQLAVNTSNVTTTGTVKVSHTLVFTINSSTAYGKIGIINAAGATININGTYTGVVGDSFQLTTGNFTAATLGTLPTLSTGLIWNTSTFLTNGTLTVSSSATTSQTIGPFSTITPQIFGAAPFAITVPTATSGLPVSVTVLSGPATISGNTVTLTGAGTMVLAADQAGNTTYLPAPEVTTTFLVAQETATVSLGNLATTFDGSPQAAAASTNPPGVSVTFTYNGSPTPPTAAGTYTVVATINDPNYQGSATGTMVISSKSSPTGLIEGADGNFYGTTQSGGFGGNGTIFRVTSGGAIVTLHNFNDGSVANDGSQPFASMLLGNDGNFYGTTVGGGTTGNGTVFQMTPGGVVTILHSFSDGSADGAQPYAALLQASDGNFYGTTFGGGSSGNGTIYKITTSGVFTVLHQFGDGSVVSDGLQPFAGLIQGSNGSLYGTTVSGGPNNDGIAFNISTSGFYSILADFTGTGTSTRGASPYAKLALGTDTNFYGTTSAGGANGDGTVFKLTQAGVLTTLTDLSTTNAGVSFSALGLIPGPSSSLYGSLQGVIFDMNFSGTISPLVTGVTASSMILGTDGNFYGTTASGGANGDGTIFKMTPAGSLSTIYTFTGAAAAGTPTAVTNPASNVLASSVQLNGTVNAGGNSATVVFQYGTDGINFPYQATFGPLTGSVDTLVDVGISNSVTTPLAPGTTYYYRVSVSTSGGGTITGALVSFLIPTVPLATASAATQITSQSAQLNGTVNAMGAPSGANVTFEYGTDGQAFPYSFSGTPFSVTGSSAVTVTATNSTTTPLVPGTPYFFRVTAVSAFGTAHSNVMPFSLDKSSQFTRVMPNEPVSAQYQGSVQVVLTTTAVTSGWRFIGEQLWRPSGTTATGLTQGQYEIEYEPVPGYITPMGDQIIVINGVATPAVMESYFPTPSGATGSLQVVLTPSSLTSGSIPVGQRLQWRFAGQLDTQWVNSGTTVGNLSPGNYLVECKQVDNQIAPLITSVPVASGPVTPVTLAYVTQASPLGQPPAAPALLPFSSVTNSPASLPYAFVGQIRSPAGTASGFVVGDQVVATAAHVVYDSALNPPYYPVSSVQWLFQRQAGVYEPIPQTPHGYYVLSGYASAHQADSADTSSPASQAQDAAALYFFAPAGAGGYVGYLASNASPNEFLVPPTQPRSAVLVGYPVDGIPNPEQGQMFATPPMNATFSQTPDSAGIGLSPYPIYTTPNITGVGGNSGGPLCVQYDDGNYYPAAIYLGMDDSGNSVVRAIDGDVTNLFSSAAISGNHGVNNLGGGISQYNTSIVSPNFTVSQLQVNFLPIPNTSSPPVGAGWALGPVPAYPPNPGGVTEDNLSPNDVYTIYFAPIAGFITPPPTVPNLVGGNLHTVDVAYEGITTQPQSTSIASGSATLSVVVLQNAAVNPATYQWQFKSSGGTSYQTIAGAQSASYNATSAGSYEVVVTWGADGSQTSSPATLTISNQQTVNLTAWENLYPALTDKTATDTPEHDGVPTLLKYLFDIDPTKPIDRSALPTAGMDTTSHVGFDYLTLTYRQYKSIDPSVVVKLQSSTDLINWIDATPAITHQTVLGNGDTMIEDEVDVTGKTKTFLRLNVSSP